MAPQEVAEQLPVLQFNEPLSWRAGKPIAVAELLRRLQTLVAELRETEQEEIDPMSLTRVAKELAHQNLLNHKDKGVRAFTACCLVDIFRLCAPNAPFTEHQLRDIFTMIITHILPSLSDPSNAFSSQYTYVLQQLATVKSIVLVTDISNSDSLILHLFTTFFDILSGSAKASTGERLAKGVEYHMMTILTVMVDEAPHLPSEAVDCIVAQFLRTDPRILGGSSTKGKKNGAVAPVDEKQSTFILKELPPAYNVAKTICNQCPEKMAREISQYFTDVITEASSSNQRHRRNSNDMNDEGHLVGPSEEDMKDLRKAHALIKELWRASPAVLQNVVPQLEAELAAENVHLRALAVETLGDMISGIGSAGPPPPPVLDVAGYPLGMLSDASDVLPSLNILTTPSSPQPFPQVHPHAYAGFLGRGKDKSAIIRTAWTTGVGRILATSAGGVGLSQYEERILIGHFTPMFNDSDERVRLAAIRAIATFSLRDVMVKLGSAGGLENPESVIANLAARVKDKKATVHTEAITTLARLWAASLGEMMDGNEQVISLVGSVPSIIMGVHFLNDSDLNVLLDHEIFEVLWPISYPPIKHKSSKMTNGNSQRIKDGQTQAETDHEAPDPDKIRVERMLFLIKCLDERAKKIFFLIADRPKSLGRFLNVYLDVCELYNGGVMDADEHVITERLSKLNTELARLLPDPSKGVDRLWKFAKMHDRRSYQLIRFCLAQDSDFHTIQKAIKEFTKRINANERAPAGLLETLIPLIYRCSTLIYNKSHIPTIMEYAKSDEKSLGSAAQEVLKHISLSCPELLTAHILGMCRDVQEQAPTESEPNSPAIVDTLKACAAFAKQYTKEIPTDRRFTQAMTNFALHGTPPEAAKHAVSIIMATSERKEMVAKDLLHQCIEGFEYGENNFLSRLAALSQLWLLAPLEMDEDGDAVVDIVIKEVLSKNRTPSTAPADKREWSNEVDTECEAKCWALKILVNRIRSHTKKESLRDVSRPVYELLAQLVAKDGELATEAKNTPPAHKSRLLLLAARLYLKLCTSRDHEQLLSAHEFNKLALIAQDNLLPVRTSFMMRLRKYLSAGILPTRFFTIPFLLAFEPNAKLKAETSTWLISQYNRLQKQKAQRLARSSADSKDTSSSKADTTLESVFARLISLLAHHPDYPLSKEELIDFSRYFIYYLSNVANDDNVSLIFHIAQKVKTCKDAIDLEDAKAEEDYREENWDERLYTLSDLAQMTIRCYEEAHNWNILTLPTYARITLPHSLFKEIKDHDVSIAIAEKMYLPDAEDIREGVEELVKKKASAHNKKRKSEGGDIGDDHKSTKKSKRLPVRESKPKASTKKKSNTTSKRKANSDGDDDDASSSDDSPKYKRKSATTKASTGNSAATRRRSGRTSGASRDKNYADRDSSEDEKELEELNRDDDDTPVEEGSSPDTEAGDDDDDDEGEEMQVEGKGAVEGVEEEEEAEAEEFDVPSSPEGRTRGKRRAKTSISPKASKVVKKTPPKAAPKAKPTPAPKAKPKTKTRGKA